MSKRRILLFLLLAPPIYIFIVINLFQRFELVEIIFALAFGNAFVASILYVSASLPGARVTGLTALLHDFFIFGLALTFTGLVVAASALLASITLFKYYLGDLLSFYAQLSLNFLLGGVTLVGASLPVLPSLFGQSKGGTTLTPQSSGERGGDEQSK